MDPACAGDATAPPLMIQGQRFADLMASLPQLKIPAEAGIHST